MWLSKKIEKDPETKKALSELSRLIDEYSDATKLTKGWLASIDRVFKPRPFLYLLTIIVAASLFFLANYYTKFDSKFFDDLINASLLISVPIFVLGITLSTAVKSLDKESRFAIEYLRDSCKVKDFTYLAFLTVVMGFLYYFVKNADCKYPCYIFLLCCEYSHKIIALIAVGGTLWCLWSLVYIIVETTKCMSPEYSTKAASTYAARKLIYGFLKQAYINIWMGKHSELLELEIKPFENIRPSHEHFTLDLHGKSTEREYVIKMHREINFHLGCRDYNINKFKKIDKLLKDNDAKLYLTPHAMNGKEWCIIRCREEHDKLPKLLTKNNICKFKKDKYIESDKISDDDHYLKLYNSISNTIHTKDNAQFRAYLVAIENVFNVMANSRKSLLLRKYYEPDYRGHRLLRLYLYSIKWILNTNLADEEVWYMFIEEITDSIERQAESDIKNGNGYVLDAFKWILPSAYKLFEKHKDSSLWKERARIGRFYYYASNTLSGYSSEIKEDDKLQIQLTLHTGIVGWLLTAIENNDNELIKALCETARILVFPENKIKFIPCELVTQHFILCGKMLKSFIGETPQIDAKKFQSLLFYEYDHTSKSVNYNEIVEFYIESRKNSLRDYLQEFNKTDWEMNPLVGGGFGETNYVFEGSEIDYTFIYLALLSISGNEKVIPIEFWHYSIKEKLAKFEIIAKTLELYHFGSQRKLFEKWMDDCGELYKQQEEQRIADTVLNPDKVSKYKNSFWDGYKKSNTFFKFCLKNGYYIADEAASTKLNYAFLKDVFIDENKEASGNRDGSEISINNDRMLMRDMIKSEQKGEEEAKGVESALNFACQWLMGKGTAKTDGIIVYCGKTYIDGKMHENKDYIPSWKNEEEKCFHGYYKNYPIFTIRSEKAEKCVALNLKGWKGIYIRPEVIKNATFGELNVREWTDEEINKFITDGKIKEEDRNRVKGQCIVEYELFWKLDKDGLPEQMTISVLKEKDDE